MKDIIGNKQLKVLTPGKIGGLELRNRIIRSGCFEGMCPGGAPSDALIDHHREVAAGGAAMTTVAYCSVSFDGRAFGHEIWMREEIVPDLKKITDAVHREGAAVNIQLGHCGYFSNKNVIGRRPIGASRKFCTFRYAFAHEMTEEEINRVKEDFGKAAQLAIQAGFDAVEIHGGHGYLLSQFLSPYTNMRKDRYGGSLENRMRFPAAVIKHVRETVGPDFPILIKMNVSDGFKGGLELDEAIEVAKRYEAEGASALVPSGGFTAKTPFYMMRGRIPLKEWIQGPKSVFEKVGLRLFGSILVQTYPFEEMFFLNEARKIKDAVSIPCVLIGGICSSDNMEKAMQEGFDFVEIGRALIREPDLVRRMERGDWQASQCDHCNRCVAEMENGGVWCVSKVKGQYKG
ncbi:MAG TPA: NADH:flavin oxidoreductase [Dehalococcoidia bacterium]|nr:NADH:flavin oxidoreductase [Dehalococcoidia bacterium]